MPLVGAELRAKDVLTADAVRVAPSASIRDLDRMSEEQEISGVPVVDQGGRVIVADDEKLPLGIITSMDLLRAFSR